MLKFRRTRRALTGLVGLGTLALAGLSSPGYAQAEDRPGRWYQIEVILFTHENSPDDETARSDVTLHYPANWVELKDPKAVAAEVQAQAAEQNVSVADSAAGEAMPATADNTPALPDLTRDPYYILPGDLRELNRQADALKRSGSHRLLLHEAWRQPVRDSASAPAIIVSAGESYDEHRELEGSISVSVSRYLHLNTNLWLTKFARLDAVPEDRDYWPELPPRPAQKQVQLNASMLLDQESGPADFNWDSSSPWQRAAQVDDNFDFSSAAVSKTYAPARISVLRQQRRMRSGEVHYLDHPEMGVVILVTPYEAAAVSGN